METLDGESVAFTGSRENRILAMVRRSPEFKEIHLHLLRSQPTGIVQLGDGLIGVTFDLKREKEYCSNSSDCLVYPNVIFMIDITQEKVIEVVTSMPDLNFMEVELRFSRAPQNDKRVKMSPIVIAKLEKARGGVQGEHEWMQGEMVIVPERICEPGLEEPETTCWCDVIVPGFLDSTCFSACTLACSFIPNLLLRAACGAACYGGCFVPAYCGHITCMTVYRC